jgi:hypothetical protein
VYREREGGLSFPSVSMQLQGARCRFKEPTPFRLPPTPPTPLTPPPRTVLPSRITPAITSRGRSRELRRNLVYQIPSPPNPRPLAPPPDDCTPSSPFPRLHPLFLSGAMDSACACAFVCARLSVVSLFLWACVRMRACACVACACVRACACVHTCMRAMCLASTSRRKCAHAHTPTPTHAHAHVTHICTLICICATKH